MEFPTVRLPMLAASLLLALASCSEPEQGSESMDQSAAIAAAGTAITNVTVIDAVNGVRENQTVIFDGDAITAVQPATAEFHTLETIDGSGKYLIPGLWDFHVHLTYDDRLTAAMPALFLSYGITSVRDTGGLIDEIVPVAEAMRADGATAPRVFYAGPLLDGEFVVYDGDGRPEIGISVPTTEDARRIVNALYDQGVSFIKVYEMVSPEVFEVLVDTANELGLPIDSHVPLSMRARVAGPRVSSIEHLRNIEMDCAASSAEFHATRLELLENPEGIPGAELRASLHSLQRLAAVADYDESECDQTIAAMRDTVMVPTLRLNSFVLSPSYTHADWDDALSRVPADVREDWQNQSASRAAQPAGDNTFAEWSLFLTGRMHDAGVPIGAGTDTPINLSVPGYSLHEELVMLVEAGLSEMEALEAATLEPAKFFSRETQMGAVQPGMVADLVLLNSNPLDDIHNARDIDLVISKGQEVQ